MAAMNSSVLAYSHTISTSSSQASRRLMPTMAPLPPPTTSSSTKFTAIRAHAQPNEPKGVMEGRRTAFIGLAAIVFSASTLAANPSANAGVFDAYLERSKANKELNDKKRLATSGANLARAYTVEFGTCKFPENFTGCQDLAKQKLIKPSIKAPASSG